MPRHRRARRSSGRQSFEALESRQLLSAAGVIEHPGYVFSPANVPASEIQGYTPAQIRQAYGFNQISDTGAGQTIAIIDPYNDPTVASDLGVFDAQFGISAPPSLKVVDQTGGTDYPIGNPGWAGEIATDVEWAHAIAPGASILLVEADSDSTSDLMSAAEYARTAPGVSVMSMSWGGSEFAGQTAYDSDFTTPAGHQGITFVAAAGDNGYSSGAQWPASSTNVLAVGGSILTTADDSGTYGSETAWISTSGGYSAFESEPAWQENVQRTGQRSMPDVAYDSDVYTGQALYDSVTYQHMTGWQTTGGTSVGTPQWAGLVALADQARATAGQSTLDGPTQTLPLLYSLYGAPGTSAYANYTTYFNDIITPDYGQSRGDPTVGYDISTGLGTPKADAIFGALVDAPAASALTDPAGPLASPLAITFAKSLPTTAIGGTSGKIEFVVTDNSAKPYIGAGTITLGGSTSATFSADPSTFGVLNLPAVKLASHASKTYTLKFTFPAQLAAGDYTLQASLTANGSAVNSAPAETMSQSTVALGPAVVDLVPSFSGAGIVRVNPLGEGTASIIVKNAGNIVGDGTLSLNLYESTDTTLDASDPLLIATPTRTIALKPGKSATIRVKFASTPGSVAGDFYLIATIQSSIGAFSEVAVAQTA